MQGVDSLTEGSFCCEGAVKRLHLSLTFGPGADSEHVILI